jgi:prepilin peptidase CpaA
MVAASIPLLMPITLAVAMLIVIVSDTTRYIIPNWLVGGLLLLYPVWVWLAPVEVDWPMGLLMAGVLLAVGFGMFALGLIGAGDAKLLMALGLYVGFSQQGLTFIIHMALLGGLLGIVLVLLRRYYRNHNPQMRILQAKAPAPYGIAIAIAFLIQLAMGGITGMTPLAELAGL